MGGTFESIILPGNLSKKEVEARINEKIRSETMEYGTDPYSGHWGTVSNFYIDPHKVFESVDLAREFVDNSLDKRSAMAVRAKDTRLPKFEATFAGKKADTYWRLGNYSSVVFESSKDYEVIAADHLPKKDQEDIIAAVNAYLRAEEAYQTKSNPWYELRNKMNSGQPFTQWDELPAAHKDWVETSRAFEEAKKKLETLDAEIHTRNLPKPPKSDAEIVWVVGAFLAC